MATDTAVAATGRRKRSVARVRLSEGSGSIHVNGQDAADYFGTALQIELLKKPFEAIGGLGKYDVIATVKGGENQVNAVQLYMRPHGHCHRWTKRSNRS